MTNEEALEILKSIEILSFRDKKRKYFMADVWKAKKVAIKALEQQPCEDCISRQDVDALVDELARKISDKRCGISRGRSTATIMQDILNLSSVTPTTPKVRQDEDCISRVQALHACCDEWNKDYKAIMKSIRQLPSITPCTNFAENQNKWIPCSERLPKEQDCYLVTIKWKGSYSGDVYIETNIAVFREKPKEWDCKGVVAWMPLPEPYKEGDNNEI